MSGSIHCNTRSFSGAFGSTFGSTPIKSSLSDCTLISNVKFSSLEYASRQKSTVCNSNSSYNYRRKNSDFSRHNRQGFSRHRNRDEYEGLEESETSMSNNGPVLSSFRNQKSLATLTPGPREWEIVELFQKVQTQLRDRAGTNEEKKVNDSPEKSKESETVDSLLELLRKHSVQKGKKNPRNARDNQEMESGSTKHSSTSIADSTLQESSKPNLTQRPKSGFRRRSPVPKIKFPNAYTDDGSVNSLAHDNVDGRSLELNRDDIDEVEAEYVEEETLFSEGKVLIDELPEDDATSESENDVREPNQIEARNLSGMKAIELRALAKSRGIKGFSKLKKNELIELLSLSSIKCLQEETA